MANGGWGLSDAEDSVDHARRPDPLTRSEAWSLHHLVEKSTPHSAACLDSN